MAGTGNRQSAGMKAGTGSGAFIYILTDLANQAEGAEWKWRVSLDSEVLPQVTYFCQPGHT